MKSAVFVLLLSAVFECNGHLKLAGLLNEAHKHVHSTVEGVAGTILGGLNFNFQGHVGVNKHQRPPPQPNGEPETVVVVVEEENNNYRPNQPGYGHNNNRPGYNNGNQGQWNGNPHGNHHHNPYDNGQGQFEHPNQYGHQNQHGHQNQYGHNHDRPGGRPDRPNQNYGQNNYQRPEQTTQGYHNNGGYNNGGHNNGGYNNGGHNNGGYNGGQNNGGYNNGEHTDGGYNNDGYNNNQGHNGNQQEHNQGNQGYQRPNQGQYGQQTDATPNKRPSTYGSIHENPTEAPTFPQTSKKPVEKDEPLFIPLNPNEYQYGGDKITITGPKRETDNNDSAEDKDEDVPIDVRFQNKS